jgi:hypothetical protein
MLNARSYPGIRKALRCLREAVADSEVKPRDWFERANPSQGYVIGHRVVRVRALLSDHPDATPPGSRMADIDLNLALRERAKLGELWGLLDEILEYATWGWPQGVHDQVLLRLDGVIKGLKRVASSAPKRGAPVKWPKALKMALRLLGEKKGRVIHRLCREKYSQEEKIPGDVSSFMRTVHRHANKDRRR